MFDSEKCVNSTLAGVTPLFDTASLLNLAMLQIPKRAHAAPVIDTRHAEQCWTTEPTFLGAWHLDQLWLRIAAEESALANRAMYRSPRLADCAHLVNDAFGGVIDLARQFVRQALRLFAVNDRGKMLPRSHPFLELDGAIERQPNDEDVHVLEPPPAAAMSDQTRHPAPNGP
jgi:hypothetical protein